MPTVFAHGTSDPFGTSAEVRDAAALIPAPTQIVEIAGARHDLGSKTLDVPGLAVAAEYVYWAATSYSDRRAVAGSHDVGRDSASLTLVTCDVRRSTSKASSSETSFITITMPMAFPISRLLASPRRGEAASSPCATALVATVANAPSTSARSIERSSKAWGVSENKLSAPGRSGRLSTEHSMRGVPGCQRARGRSDRPPTVRCKVRLDLSGALFDGVQTGPTAECDLELVDLARDGVTDSRSTEGAVVADHQAGWSYPGIVSRRRHTDRGEHLFRRGGPSGDVRERREHPWGIDGRHRNLLFWVELFDGRQRASHLEAPLPPVGIKR